MQLKKDSKEQVLAAFAGVPSLGCRKELIAALILAGMLARETPRSIEGAVERAVEAADLLLARLDQE